jgi:FAD/FMN-containing dehydrogenase
MTALLAPVALERREGWGMSTATIAHVVAPRTAEDVIAAFHLARERGWSVTAWGNGRSYGDAPLNEGNLVLDMGRMDRILAWDREAGIITVQPGLTLRQLWQAILPDGYWPPVVSGTMMTTLGGLAAANAHGKNNKLHGPIGDHLLAFTIVTPDGQERTVDREHDAELFHAAIGGFGTLGVFTSLTLRCKRVYSGRLDVQPLSCPDLESMFRNFERYEAEGWDYVVGWIDAFPSGADLGRGQIHAARYFGKGEDPEGERMFSVDAQELPSTILGFPKAWMWAVMRPWANRLGMRIVNQVRFTQGSLARSQHRHPQGHAQFNFLLDYVPNWKWIYRPTGLIQIQLFLPKERARDTFRRALEVQQAAGLESWLVVMKRHRPDDFWLSHAVDGYSFAMDFPVRPGRRGDLDRLARRLEGLVVESGGRFYLAKDSLLSPSAFARSLGPEVLGRFFGVKDRVDPDGLLQGNLWRRVFAPLRSSIPPIPSEPGVVWRSRGEPAPVPDPHPAPEPATATIET